jgi:hypothetical protein
LFSPVAPKEKNMNRFLILLSIPLLLIPLVVCDAVAVSPMPEEIQKGQSEKSIQSETAAVCMVKIIYKTDKVSGKPPRGDFSHSVVIEVFAPKREAIEKTVGSIDDKLKEEDISEVKIECRFPELRPKEQ